MQDKLTFLERHNVSRLYSVNRRKSLWNIVFLWDDDHTSSGKQVSHNSMQAMV